MNQQAIENSAAITPRTVVRSGAGVFYGGQGSLGANGRMVSNFPFYRSVTLQSAGGRPAFRAMGR